MPELPEVETVRRHLEPIRGRRVTAAEVLHPRVERRHEEGRLADRLSGRTVGAVGRRGKFLLLDLDDDAVWIIHLGMSGRIRILPLDDPRDAHTVLAVALDDVELRFIDPRTFGFSLVVSDTGPIIGHLGPDALAVSVEYVEKALRGRRAPIKALLLDQTIVAGLGNIYADEVLFRAGIRPDRPGGSLEAAEVTRLHGVFRPVLAQALARGGTTLDDMAFLLPDGTAASQLASLYVYGRTDLACRQCGQPVERMTIRARSAHYCSRCQR
jgi:formamidopyrimidine-DNA glycosylase